MGAQRRRASKYQPSPKFRGLTGANFRYIRLTYFQRFAFFDGARDSGEGEAFGGISRNGGARFQRKRPRILPVKSGLGRNNEPLFGAIMDRLRQAPRFRGGLLREFRSAALPLCADSREAPPQAARCRRAGRARVLPCRGSTFSKNRGFL